MMDMVQSFPDQLEESLELFAKTNLRKNDAGLSNIYVSGMGGSAVGANFVEAIIRNESMLPFSVGKSYSVPNYISQHTLAIVSSYSGNTEETISAFQQLLAKKARLIVISSGGELLRLAEELKIDYIKLPSGWSSPRACLAYSLCAQLFTLEKLNVIGPDFINQIESAIQLIRNNKNGINDQALQLAELIKGKWLVFYSSDRFEPVSIRARQQINENSKMLCWHHVIPEMNHNELVGWRWNHPTLAAIFIRDHGDYHRIQARMELTKEIVSHYAGSVIDVFCMGNSFLEKSLYLVHLFDLLSVHLAEFNAVDSVEVRVIDFLKNELSKMALPK